MILLPKLFSDSEMLYYVSLIMLIHCVCSLCDEYPNWIRPCEPTTTTSTTTTSAPTTTQAQGNAPAALLPHNYSTC